VQSKPARQLEQCGGFQVSSIVAQQFFFFDSAFVHLVAGLVPEKLLWFKLNIRV